MKSAVAVGLLEFIEDFVTLDHPSNGIIPFQPFAGQRELVDRYCCNQYNLIKKERQTGITSITLAYILARVLAHGINVRQTFVVAAPSAGRREVLMDMFFNMFDGIDFDMLGMYPRIKPSTVNSTMEFLDSGDVVRFVNANDVTCLRGIGVHFAYLDEFDFVGDKEQSQFLTSIQSSLSTYQNNSELIIASTPKGNNSTFTNLWDLSCNKITGFTPSMVSKTSFGINVSSGRPEDGILTTIRDPNKAYDYAMGVL